MGPHPHPHLLPPSSRFTSLAWPRRIPPTPHVPTHFSPPSVARLPSRPPLPLPFLTPLSLPPQSRVAKARSAVAAGLALPPWLSYASVPGLSAEEVEKLSRARPSTLRLAQGISGVTPSGIDQLIRHVQHGRTLRGAPRAAIGGAAVTRSRGGGAPGGVEAGEGLRRGAAAEAGEG
jgi:hypothetical protein